jgi:hypothetical protein
MRGQAYVCRSVGPAVQLRTMSRSGEGLQLLRPRPDLLRPGLRERDATPVHARGRQALPADHTGSAEPRGTPAKIPTEAPDGATGHNGAGAARCACCVRDSACDPIPRSWTMLATRSPARDQTCELARSASPYRTVGYMAPEKESDASGFFAMADK